MKNTADLKLIPGQILVVLAILMVSLSAQAQSGNASLLGKWRSVGKKDSLNLNFLSASVVVIDAMDKLKNQKYFYNIDTLKKQLILVMHPEGSDFKMKLLLWKTAADEIKLQGVDFQNYDNPLLDLPKANEKNTFILHRTGS